MGVSTLKNPHRSNRDAVRPPPSSAKRFAVNTTVGPPLDSYLVANDPPKQPLCLIDKAETLRRVSLTYVTVWKLMRDNKFPRSRNLGGKSAWLEHEIEAWIKARPIVPIKGENQQEA